MKYLVLLISILVFSSVKATEFPNYKGVVNDYENVFNDKQEKVLN